MRRMRHRNRAGVKPLPTTGIYLLQTQSVSDTPLKKLLTELLLEAETSAPPTDPKPFGEPGE